MKLDWRAVLGFVIAILLLWWVVRGQNPGELWHHVRGANFWLLGAGVAVATAGFFLRAVRWRVLLRPLRPEITLHSSFAAVAIGFMANNLLPARIGELVRAYAISRLEPIPLSASVGSLVLERLLDALVVLLLLLIAVAAPGFPADAQVEGLPIAGILNWIGKLLVLMIAGLVALMIWPRALVGMVEGGVNRLLPHRIAAKVVGALEAFLEGLSALRSPRLMALALSWSLLFWVWHSFSFWLGFRAFGIDLSFFAALFTNGVVAVAAAIPAGPAFTGTFHYAVKESLHGVYGASEGAATAFAFSFHLLGLIPITAIGLHYAWRVGLSLREIRGSGGRPGKAVDETGTGEDR